MVRALLTVLRHPYAVAVGRRLLDQPGRYLVLALLRHALDQRPVGLLGVAPAKSLGELHRRKAGAGDDQHARRVAVEAVHQPRLLALGIAPSLQHVVDMADHTRTALHGKPGRLVEDEDFWILVD